MKAPFAVAAAPVLITEIAECWIGRLPPGTAIVPHLHHFFQLDVYLEGKVMLALDQRPALTCGRGDCVLIPPLGFHGYETLRGFRQLSFKFFLAPACWPVFGSAPRRAVLDAPLLKVLETTARTIEAENPLAEHLATALLTLCLGRVAAANPVVSGLRGDGLESFRERLWPLLAEVAGAPERRWTVAAMAARCNMQVDYFTRCFRRVLGQTPRRHLLDTRMRAAAADLLRSPRLTIEAIAERCGYADLHGFTRAFSSHVGIAPAAFRRARPVPEKSDSAKSLSFPAKDK